MLKNDQHIIGVFVDYHNLMISLRKSFTLPYPDISLVKNYAGGLGKIVIFHVYGDWNLFNKHRRHLKTLGGIKLINEPHMKTYGKNKEIVDMRMAFDIGVCLERSPEIDLFILVSGDNHFLTVLKQIRIRGKKILIIAEQNSLSLHLKKNFAPYILTYQKLVENFLKTSTKDSKISRLLPSKMEEGVIVYEKY